MAVLLATAGAATPLPGAEAPLAAEPVLPSQRSEIATPGAPQAPPLSLHEVFDEATAGRIPAQLVWAPDGRRLGYVFDDGEGEALWIADLETGAHRLVLRLAELAPAAEAGAATLPPGPAAAAAAAPYPRQARLGGYQFAPDGASLLLESGGDLHRLDLATGERRRLTRTDAEASAPAFSPDGRRIAFVRDFNLHLLDLAPGGAERALTTDGEADAVLNGTTDWVYFEEIWGRKPQGFWWSPDGRKIAFYRFDEAAVKGHPLTDPLPLDPRVRWQKYPRAGEANPAVRVGVLDVENRETVWLDTGAEPDVYLARVTWTPDSRRVAVQRLDRDQTRLDLLLCDPTTGESTVLLADTAPTWVNLHDDLRFLAGGGFLWSSEKSGWRRLYRHGPDGGEIGVLTPEGWALTSLDGVDEEAGWAVATGYTTSGLGAAHRRVLRLPLAGGEPTPLTPPSGWHAAQVAPRGGAWIHTASDADTPPALTLRGPGGEPLPTTLPASAPGVDLSALPAWEILTLPGPEGTSLPAARLLPGGFDPERRYPVIVYHYGCPASQVVAAQWGLRARNLWHKRMAQRGVLVLALDNAGSAFFGKRGEERDHRRFGTVHLPALAAALDYLRSLPYVDPKRIGIWGWSGGGSNTLAALLHFPGAFRAGVAGAAVTDWRLYDSVWTERYLDRPEDNPGGYAASSPLTRAADLADALLLVHGTADDNVHPENTLVLADALVKAGKPFEMALYPGQKHAFEPGPQRHFYERMTEFFTRWLGLEP